MLELISSYVPEMGVGALGQIALRAERLRFSRKRTFALRESIAGIPVLTVVRDTYSDAWSAFGGEFVETLAPCPDSTLDWCRAVLGRDKATTSST
ncbi:DUF2478 domain-containing protein [Mesorhizobium sp. A556]